MWSLRAVFLLLTACLAVSASPVVTPPDYIQVQENFDISRVRLASLVAMALWGAAGGRSPDLELGAGSLGALPAQTIWGSLKLRCYAPAIPQAPCLTISRSHM